MLQDLFRDKSTSFYTTRAVSASKQDIHSPVLAFGPRQLGNRIPTWQTFARASDNRHPVSTTPGKPSLERRLQNLMPPLCTTSPSPMPASVSCQDHEELWEGTRKRQGLSDVRGLCNPCLSCSSGLPVILFCHHTPPWHHLTQHLLLIASKVCTYSRFFQTLQLCT